MEKVASLESDLRHHTRNETMRRIFEACEPFFGLASLLGTALLLGVLLSPPKTAGAKTPTVSDQPIVRPLVCSYVADGGSPDDWRDHSIDPGIYGSAPRRPASARWDCFVEGHPDDVFIQNWVNYKDGGP